MPMPGAWAMSMPWMRMPAQTWPGAAASFVGMWVAMMVPMMLPSVAPVLWRHREALKVSGVRRPNALIAMTSAGYFFVWAVLGAAAYPLGASAAAVVTNQPLLARGLPIATGITVMIAGAIQLTSWKAHRLACCQCRWWRDASRPISAAGAWRDGVRLGARCVACCANLMVILLVMGVMDARAMAVVGATITAERLSPRGEQVARVTGLMFAAAGCLLIRRAVGL